MEHGKHRLKRIMFWKQGGLVSRRMLLLRYPPFDTYFQRDTISLSGNILVSLAPFFTDENIRASFPCNTDIVQK